MQEEADPYDPERLIEIIEKFDWSDLLKAEGGRTPVNDHYQFQPPKPYERYYQLFRAALNNDQHSERTFQLTGLILKLKQNNYYALMLRKAYFYSLQKVDKALLKSEIAFVNNLLDMNSKEYQLWVYKKDIFSRYNTAVYGGDQFYNSEKEFLEQLLEMDSKNYHVWDYKLWLTLHFRQQQAQILWTEVKLFKGDQVKKVIEEQLKESELNVYAIKWQNCYSLWSYRFNLVKATFLKLPAEQKKVFQDQELERLKTWLKKEQNTSNECGWNYLTGAAISFETKSKYSHISLYTFAKEIFSTYPKNRFVGNTCLQMLQFLREQYKYSDESQQKNIILKLNEIDSVRELYYDYLLKQ